MWLFTKNGFFSIVEMQGNDNTFFVRSRQQQDLENLFRFIEKRTIFRSLSADYKYRIIIKPKELLLLAQSLVSEIDYPNFKSQIAKTAGQERKLECYHEVWAIMKSSTI
jgi:hypothetical protein